MSKLLNLYKTVGADRYGPAIAEIAPYFGTISARFVELRPGYCELIIPHTRAVENHLGTVHAIALCNGAELAAGLLTDVSIPEDCRWIPVGMTVAYLKKARGDQRIVADGIGLALSTPGQVIIPAQATDPQGAVVFTASITMTISRT